MPSFNTVPRWLPVWHRDIPAYVASRPNLACHQWSGQVGGLDIPGIDGGPCDRNMILSTALLDEVCGLDVPDPNQPNETGDDDMSTCLLSPHPVKDGRFAAATVHETSLFLWNAVTSEGFMPTLDGSGVFIDTKSNAPLLGVSRSGDWVVAVAADGGTFAYQFLVTPLT